LRQLERGAATVGVELPPASVELLAAYTELLIERALPLGMIARDDRDRIVPRHVVDSLRAGPALAWLGAKRVVDLGSGAGLPGIPLAIAMPEVHLTLAEARSKRAAFLELVVERLSLTNVTVHPARAETLAPFGFDTAVARAFASPAGAWVQARALLSDEGALVLFAGAREPLPANLPDAKVETFEPRVGAGGGSRSPENWRSSHATPLATAGDLVIIRRT
jgi:16S rRNA (guanine527-N7)-methyltransferase